MTHQRDDDIKEEGVFWLDVKYGIFYLEDQRFFPISKIKCNEFFRLIILQEK